MRAERRRQGRAIRKARRESAARQMIVFRDVQTVMDNIDWEALMAAIPEVLDQFARLGEAVTAAMRSAHAELLRQASRRCGRDGCPEIPDAPWSFCPVHLAEEQARGAEWAARPAAVRSLDITDVKP